MADGKPKTRHRLQASTTTNTYNYCYRAARYALERVRVDPSGGVYGCMSAGVFAAFTVEAFLNHIGKHCLSDWDVVERKLSPRDKLELIAKRLKFDIDQGRRPYQTFATMLALRDSLAHGKTETVEIDRVLSREPTDVDECPEPAWKQLCTLKSAERLVVDAEAMVRDLNKKARFKRDPFVSMGHGSSGVSPVRID